LKILDLTVYNKTYTSNVYLILGSHNALDDVNTLIDVGSDTEIINKINAIDTGVGKKCIERVIITHNHYDHTGILPLIKEKYNPEICAFSKSVIGVNHILRDGERIKIGDCIFEVIHTPGHSTDSICLHCRKEGVLFVGDTPLYINSAIDTYYPNFINSMKKLARKKISTIYFGHRQPVYKNAKRLIYDSIGSLIESEIVKEV